MAPNPQLFLYDLAGTILDSIDFDREILDDVCFKYAKTSYQEMKPLKDRTKSIRANFPKFFHSDAKEAYDLYLQKITDVIPECRLFPEVHTALSALKDRGVKTGIVSNRPKSYVKNVVQYFEIQSMIDIIVTPSSPHYIEKPDPGLLDVVREKLANPNLTNENMLIIGDSLVDYKFAIQSRTNGALFILSTPPEELKYLRRKLGSESNTFLFECHSKIVNAYTGDIII